MIHFMGQTALLASTSAHVNELIARSSKDSMVTVFAVVFGLDSSFLLEILLIVFHFGLMGFQAACF